MERGRTKGTVHERGECDGEKERKGGKKCSNGVCLPPSKIFLEAKESWGGGGD